jgi:hypothetical protein
VHRELLPWSLAKTYLETLRRAWPAFPHLSLPLPSRHGESAEPEPLQLMLKVGTKSFPMSPNSKKAQPDKQRENR